MDNAAFATWRAEIGLLTVAQRGLAFFDLALAEADGPIEHPDDEIGETAPPDEIARAPAVIAPTAVGLPVEEKPEPELLSKVGRDRIACLAVLIAAISRPALGAARTACLGIAARPAGRRSLR